MPFLLLFLITPFAQASHLNESDLAPAQNIQTLNMGNSKSLTPDLISTSVSKNSEIVVLRKEGGTTKPVVGLGFTAKGINIISSQDGKVELPNCKQSTKLKAVLKAEKFKIYGSDGTYELEVTLVCNQSQLLVFETDSKGGQALGIWQVAYTAQEKLRSSVGLNFWSQELKINWPSNGDYYQMNTVNLTKGHHWDVVGHEIGHGIYDLADLGGFGWGSHKIDECYTEALALSEGWASYFSAWLRVDLNDNDAKFQYLVPRRAPIHFEHVPSDVCRGVANEWRVTSFLWDLIDLNSDSEHATESFQKLWLAMAGKGANSIKEVVPQLQMLGMDAQLLQIAWDLNF